MKIYVPSSGRWDGVARGPLTQMSSRLRSRVSFVVPPEQVDRYARALVDSCLGMPDNVQSCEVDGHMGWKRHAIGLLARDAGHERFICIDDDVNFVIRKSDDNWHLRQSTRDEVDEVFDVVEKLLDTYGHVGIGTRQGNNRLGLGPRPILLENTRTLRCLAYRTADFLSVEHGRVRVMEDFDVNLQLLRKGVANCSVNYWAQDQKATNAPGGCSPWRTREMHDATAEQLSELHPRMVTVREKEYKTGGTLGTRTEVTIRWKNAYKSSMR